MRGELVAAPASTEPGAGSDTAEIAFDACFVPEENLLGAEHGGFYLIMANFQWERLLMALEIEAGRDITYHALRLHLAGHDAVREVTIAKLRNQRAACERSTPAWVCTVLTRRPSLSAPPATPA